MAHANYREIERNLVPNLAPFTHGSCHAVNNLDREYVVVSYNTAIARITVDPETGERTIKINGKKYSATTTRLQNIIRRVFPDHIEVYGDRELY